MICTRGDVRARDRLERLLAGLDRHSVGADPAVGHHLIEVLEDRVAVIHAIRRAVQLNQIHGVDAEVGARALVPCAEVLRRVVLGELLDPASHLGRHEDLRMAFQQRSVELLAAPVAVDVGGVEEGDAGVHRRLERRLGVARIDRSPVGAELPRPEPDHADTAAEAFDYALFHGSILSAAVVEVAVRVRAMASLDDVDLSLKLSDDEAAERLERAQKRLLALRLQCGGLLGGGTIGSAAPDPVRGLGRRR